MNLSGDIFLKEIDNVSITSIYDSNLWVDKKRSKIIRFTPGDGLVGSTIYDPTLALYDLDMNDESIKSWSYNISLQI